MEFFLDVDGVILDFEASFINFIRDKYIPDLPRNYRPVTWGMVEEFPGLDIQEVWERFVDSRYFSDLDLLITTEQFNRLADRYPVCLVTNLPFDLYDIRKRNLEKYNLNFKKLYLGGHFKFGREDYPSKSEVISKVRNSGKEIIFLDDLPKNCLEVKRAFPQSRVFLMSRRHNDEKENPDWIRVKNWNDFLSRVLEKE